MDLSESFWDHRYKNEDTGWDLGEVSPPIKDYVDQLTNKDLTILIPGGGNSHEAEYLYNKGFKNVFVVDISKTALSNLKNRVPSFPATNLIHKNFFDLERSFDLILEQTFFCAINPYLRTEYVKKAFELLNKNGKIVGLLFNETLNNDRPPFGGNKTEYQDYFKKYFNISKMEKAYNSHQSRKGKELFIKLMKS